MIWNEAEEEWKPPPQDKLAIFRAIIRIAILLLTLFLLMIPYVLVRHTQRIFGLIHKELPILQLWGFIAIRCFGLRVNLRGKIQIKGGVITANHINFADIPVLFRVVPGFMMAKSEIKEMFFIGWCARLLGTEFVKRDRAATPKQVESLHERLEAGDRMVLFPEATTTDGQRVIPFRSSLFSAIAKVEEEEGLVQPVSMFYHPPKGASLNFFGFWGDAPLLPRFWTTFCSKGLKTVDVILHDPLPAGMARKEMALAAEEVVRAGVKELRDGFLASEAGRHFGITPHQAQ